MEQALYRFLNESNVIVSITSRSILFTSNLCLLNTYKYLRSSINIEPSEKPREPLQCRIRETKGKDKCNKIYLYITYTNKNINCIHDVEIGFRFFTYHRGYYCLTHGCWLFSSSPLSIFILTLGRKKQWKRVILSFLDYMTSLLPSNLGTAVSLRMV